MENSVDSKTEPQSNRGSHVVPLEEAEGRTCRRMSRRIASARCRSRGRVPPRRCWARSRADSDDSAPGERRNRSSKGLPKRYIPV